MVTRRTRLVVAITPASLDGDDAAALRDRADWTEPHNVLTMLAPFGRRAPERATSQHAMSVPIQRDPAERMVDVPVGWDPADHNRPPGFVVIGALPIAPDVPHFGPIQAGLTPHLPLPNRETRGHRETRRSGGGGLPTTAYGARC
jgi:hypothetical protein